MKETEKIRVLYRRPGFNCVVKQLRFWCFKVDCEFKDCDLCVLRIGHTCVIYTLLIASSEKNRNSQSLNYAIETRPTVYDRIDIAATINFSTQFGAASIREQRLFRSARVRAEIFFSEKVNDYNYDCTIIAPSHFRKWRPSSSPSNFGRTESLLTLTSRK